ncbi:MAG: hypothetical protein DMF29_04645 [Verrucomicrobia bacterium]|nr:MAG: hypothetical protein DMF29_04645 [Verrucomicrobiota bacterium]
MLLGTLLVVFHLSRVRRISTGEPLVQASHQCRLAVSRRFRTPHTSHSKTSVDVLLLVGEIIFA